MSPPEAAALGLADCLYQLGLVQLAVGEESSALMNLNRAHGLLTKHQPPIAVKADVESNNTQPQPQNKRAIAIEQERKTLLCKIMRVGVEFDATYTRRT